MSSLVQSKPAGRWVLEHALASFVLAFFLLVDLCFMVTWFASGGGTSRWWGPAWRKFLQDVIQPGPMAALSGWAALTVGTGLRGYLLVSQVLVWELLARQESWSTAIDPSDPPDFVSRPFSHECSLPRLCHSVGPASDGTCRELWPHSIVSHCHSMNHECAVAFLTGEA